MPQTIDLSFVRFEAFSPFMPLTLVYCISVVRFEAFSPVLLLTLELRLVRFETCSQVLSLTIELSFLLLKPLVLFCR